MKKVLFVHDGPIYTNNERSIFYGVHYNDALVKRYAYLGDQVTFLTRSSIISDAEGHNFSLIRHPAFSFIEVPNFKSIKTYFNKRKAKNIVKKAVELDITNMTP